MTRKRSWKKWKRRGDPHLINRIEWDDAEATALESVLDEDWFGYGEQNRQFEEKLSDITGIHHFNLTNSGSAALWIALKGIAHQGRVKPGDKIIHPITTFATSVSCAIDMSLVPVYVETAPNTYVVDPEKIEQALKKHPDIQGAIIPYLLGSIPDMDRIREALGDRFLIEDACDTMQGCFGGQPIGSFGDYITFSFYGSHHITSGGVGGAVGTNHAELSAIAKSLIFWGRDFSAGDSFLDRYKYLTIGTDSQMSAIQAAFGLAQMSRLEDFIVRRKQQFAEMTTILERYDYFDLPISHPAAEPHWFAYPLQIKPGAPFTREEFVVYLTEHNVEIRPIMCGNILRQKPFAEADHRVLQEEHPVADRIERDGIFIPCWGMPDDEKSDYHETLESFFSRYA